MASAVNDNTARLKGLKAALKDDTDFQIVVGEHYWDVHKDVLASQSTFFKAVIQGPWTESRNKSVTLTGEDVWMVGRMIQFFYGNTFSLDHQSSLHVEKNKVYMQKGVKRVKTTTKALPTLIELMAPFRKTKDYELLRHLDEKRNDLEKIGCMYVLADKYGCEDLRCQLLRKFDLCTPTPAALPKAFSGVFGQLIENDTRLKAVVASHLARCYKILRSVKRTSDWLELWLASDAELGLLVMDRMIAVEKRTEGMASHIAEPSTVPAVSSSGVVAVKSRRFSSGTVRIHRYPRRRRAYGQRYG